MTSTLSLTVTEDGLRLPRRLFRQTGEVEVIEQADYILIKLKADDWPEVRARALAALREAGLIVTLDWPQPPVVTPAKRAELALNSRRNSASDSHFPNTSSRIETTAYDGLLP